MRLKTIYVCEKCSTQHMKWQGQCTNCGAWNSLIEDVINPKETKKQENVIAARSHNLKTDFKEKTRIETKINEFDRVLGKGIVPGTLIMLTGEPGIGKSTLMLQTCNNISEQNKKILYITGEESADQIHNRANRLKVNSENILVVSANNLESILKTIEEKTPDLIIVDSIQVIQSNDLDSFAGSVSQIRHCTEVFMQFAKTSNIPIIITGHVNKDGNLAGPKLLEHLVDVVIYIEGDRYQNLRIIRAIKNRYGSTNEIGIFEMEEGGLIEVTNPSKIFLEGRPENAIGSVIIPTIEGNRSFLVEVQALTNSTNFGYPKRTASGYDTNRLQLLLAVLQKHLGLKLGDKDVYLNIVGGFNLKEPALDLAICTAIISSIKKIELPNNLIAFGEVGLSGEIRNVNKIEKRLKESSKLGIQKAITPIHQFKTDLENQQIKSVSEIEKALSILGA